MYNPTIYQWIVIDFTQMSNNVKDDEH